MRNWTHVRDILFVISTSVNSAGSLISNSNFDVSAASFADTELYRRLLGVPVPLHYEALGIYEYLPKDIKLLKHL